MKHILSIQDLSCVGECSNKAAIAVFSVMGHEVSVLPVSLLSNHTAFQHAYIHPFKEELNEILDVWKKEGISFDCVLSGYLSNKYQVELVESIVQTFLKEDGIYICDPAMADHGSLYKGFDVSFVEAMEKLVQKADIILPNISEACLLTKTSYDTINENTQSLLLKNLADRFNSRIILTGASFSNNETGVLIADKDTISAYSHKKIEGSYFGTGDLFAAVFTGAFLNKNDLLSASRKACDFVCNAIEQTDPDHWYGVQFEKILKEL